MRVEYEIANNNSGYHTVTSRCVSEQKKACTKHGVSGTNWRTALSVNKTAAKAADQLVHDNLAGQLAWPPRHVFETHGAHQGVPPVFPKVFHSRRSTVRFYCCVAEGRIQAEERSFRFDRRYPLDAMKTNVANVHCQQGTPVLLVWLYSELTFYISITQ
jgi:hypothetical protein